MFLRMDTMRFSMARRPLKDIMEKFKRVLWGQLDRLGTRVRESRNMWEVGKFLATTVGKVFCKKGLWGKLGRLGTRLREYSNMETNTIVRED